MVNLSGVAMEFGTQELYRGVDLFVGPNDRIGLVGHNGSGKSTILRLIAGELQPTAGTVTIRKGTRIAYLPQTIGRPQNRTVLEEAMAAWEHLDGIRQQMLECEQLMNATGAAQPEMKSLLDRYAQLQQLQGHDSHAAESKAQKMLVSLGFTEDEFHRPLATQSGGFRVRATLARLLLEEPDLLLLDEPTNYLDIRSIEWLQEYLLSFRGAIVMIAHDRYLLDAIVSRIWGIESHSVIDFPGNYSAYLTDREKRQAQQRKMYEEQQAFIKRTEQFIAKFKGRKDTAKRAMSRQKMLDKLERIQPPEVLPEIRFRFPEADDIYGKAFELRNVSHSFGDHRVLSGVNLTVAGGEKIGVFGANGQGKTTFLKILAGRLRPSTGTVWLSQKVRIAFYEQGAEDALDPDDTVLEAVASAGSGFSENELKAFLGMFLFSGDAIDKPVKVLSGGERSRLAIIRVLLTPSNLLVLDEPTNHLDIRSREVLFEAIAAYRRTVVFSAHDRYMLDRLADKTIRIESGEAVLFPGNFAYAVRKATAVTAAAGGSRRSRTTAAEPPKVPPAAVEKKAAASRLSQLLGRLESIDREYAAARDALDFARARMLAAERREVEAEIEVCKAEEVSTSGSAE